MRIPLESTAGIVEQSNLSDPYLSVTFSASLAKVLGLFVTGLYLEMCELSRFLIGKQDNLSLKLGCRPA